MRQAETKEKVRQIMREKCRQLSDAGRERLSHKASNCLFNSPLWKNAGIIGLFVSLPDEISTLELLEQAWREGKEIFLPKISPNEKGFMDFYKCSSLSELKKGRFGLSEPSGLTAVMSQADLMILPGLAFDRRGTRLGYGGGYYDRYLSTRPQLEKRCLGFAYGFQIQNFLVSDAYDFKMTFLCTEEGIIWSNA